MTCGCVDDLMDASERAARGFDADEELVLGCRCTPTPTTTATRRPRPPKLELRPRPSRRRRRRWCLPPPPPPEPAAQIPPVRCSPAYLAEVRRRSDAASHRAEAALADLPAAAAAAAALPAFALDVRDASELSISECRREYVARFRPLVIRGVGPLTEPSPWSLPFLRGRTARSAPRSASVGRRWRRRARWRASR